MFIYGGTKKFNVIFSKKSAYPWSLILLIHFCLKINKWCDFETNSKWQRRTYLAISYEHQAENYSFYLYKLKVYITDILTNSYFSNNNYFMQLIN